MTSWAVMVSKAEAIACIRLGWERAWALIESSLIALRANVHSALNTNAKIIALWKELVDRFGPAR